MAATETTSTTPALPTEGRAELTAQYARLLDEIPWAADDDGSSIILDLLAATTWEQLNTGGKLPKLETFVGQTLKVLSVEKRASEIEGGMPVYLELLVQAGGKGEPVKVQTSAGSVMVKLTMLHHFGNLPALVLVTKAEKKTRAGFYPLDITIQAAEPRKGAS